MYALKQWNEFRILQNDITQNKRKITYIIFDDLSEILSIIYASICNRCTHLNYVFRCIYSEFQWFSNWLWCCCRNITECIYIIAIMTYNVIPTVMAKRKLKLFWPFEFCELFRNECAHITRLTFHYK